MPAVRPTYLGPRLNPNFQLTNPFISFQVIKTRMFDEVIRWRLHSTPRSGKPPGLGHAAVLARPHLRGRRRPLASPQPPARHRWEIFFSSSSRKFKGKIKNESRLLFSAFSATLKSWNRHLGPIRLKKFNLQNLSPTSQKLGYFWLPTRLANISKTAQLSTKMHCLLLVAENIFLIAQEID